MPEPTDNRVAVYIDFDNIVISRYAQVHPKFRRDQLKDIDLASASASPELADRLRDATIDIGAIIDFASSFGSVVISRAYADWSAYINAGYREQLIGRAVDLVQLFPTVKSGKNGADIRLAVDVVEDLFRLPDLTHIVIVAGDSDYIALAQRSRRLGRYVVGIGVAGSTSASLADACDKFESYDDLPGIDVEQEVEKVEAATPPPRTTARVDVAKKAAVEPVPPAGKLSAKAASTLLVRALRNAQSKDDDGWIPSPTVKNVMIRLNPSFNDKALGYSSFTKFVESRSNIVEINDETGNRRLKLRPEFEAK